MATSSGKDVLDYPFALKYEHKHDKITINDTKELKVTNSLTMECWIHLLQDSTGYIIAKKQSFALAVKKQGTTNSLMISLNNAKPGWVWKNTKCPLPLQKWCHVVVTYEAEKNEAIVYIDGVPVKVFDAMTGPLESTTNDLYFGLHLVEENINCMLSDVRLWNVALSVEKIHLYMKEQPARTDPRLIGWWPLNKGYGVEIEDISNNKLHGELSGGNWVQSQRMGFAAPSTVISDFKSMINNPIGSDVILHADSRSIYAHRIILCQRSSVFRAMLLGEMKEGTMKEVTINDISFEVLHKLIEFLYTDQSSFDGESVLELFIAADKFDQPRLKYLCEKFMLENICIENVCTVLEAADKLNAPILRGECMKFILAHPGEIMASDVYLDLERDVMKEVQLALARQYFPCKKRKLNNGTAVSTQTDAPN
eukprot:TRINITY_DN3960_c0_g1_i1.p1 TRINITY_DN3960_c0_g1~~TRINITY_DN3960_c0_g1_i1.p1  ORF type:complete len:424 (+),score=124.23 TRINITY_DN3960_c0_g1_i1:198-1469(+)